jgi:prepilin-type processing-associated H-X9-DG protein
MRFLKKMTIGGIVGFVLMLVGAICYPYSIGVFPFVDILGKIGLLIGFYLSVTVLVALAVSALYFLVRLRLMEFMLVFPCILPIVATAVIMPPMGVIPPYYFKIECSEYLNRIEKETKEFAANHAGRLPGTDWRDELLAQGGLMPKDLCCRGLLKYFKEGESSYAMNNHIMGLTLSELPPDTVLFYETDFAGIDPELSIQIQQRKSYDIHSFSTRPATAIVRFGAWSQVGDIEYITASHHAGLGCNVLFADGHVEFVRKKYFTKLKWKPD